MSTRASTITYDNNHKQLYNHYCHYDGYPDGHGKELAQLLLSCESFSGIEQTHVYLDGMELIGCEIENNHITHPDIEYLYQVTLGDTITLTITSVDWNDSWKQILDKKPIFKGTPKEFIQSLLH